MSLGTHELSQACGGTLLMWQRTMCGAPILAKFSLFLPSSSHCGATLKSRRSQSSWLKCHTNSRKSTGNFTEVRKRHPTPRSDSFEMSHLFGPANYMIFGTMWIYPIYVYEPLLEPGRNLLPMPDTPVLTDHGNVDSTLREEPSKTVTLYENLGHPCNVDDSE